jgi:hypothetical protein
MDKKDFRRLINYLRIEMEMNGTDTSKLSDGEILIMHQKKKNRKLP